MEDLKWKTSKWNASTWNKPKLTKHGTQIQQHIIVFYHLRQERSFSDWRSTHECSFWRAENRGKFIVIWSVFGEPDMEIIWIYQYQYHKLLHHFYFILFILFFILFFHLFLCWLYIRVYIIIIRMCATCHKNVWVKRWFGWREGVYWVELYLGFVISLWPDDTYDLVMKQSANKNKWTLY